MKTLLLLWKAFDYSLQGVRNTFYDELPSTLTSGYSYFNSCCTAIVCFTDSSYFADCIRLSCIDHSTA